MFIGHFGAALGAKKLSTAPSLGTLIMASIFIDLLWPIFLLLGIEHVEIEPGNTEFTPLDFIYYPFSHGLISVIIWAILFGAVYYLVRKNYKAAVILGILVISHWILDLITHRPDLPIVTGEGTKVGFGLWNSVILTIIVESLIFAIGLWLYMKVTKPKNRIGIISFWGLVLFLIVMYFITATGNPPPSEQAIGYVGLTQWLFVAWGYWIDKNRSAGVESTIY